MRDFLKAAAMSAALVLGLPATTASAAGPVKNIVLVHGAWADGSGWKAVYDMLVKDGYKVSVVANPDTAVADDVAATQRVLDRQDGPVILVGHSYGGVIITEAGVDPKVVGLVYVAAFAPDVGETAGQFLTGGPPPIEVSKDGVAFLKREAFLGGFAPDVPMASRVFMADSQVPIAVATLSTPITKAAWKTKPSWYMVAANDQVIPPAVERTFAKRMKAVTVEAASSHVAYVSHPEETAKLIEDAAKGATK